jgi:hypothetical protein
MRWTAQHPAAERSVIICQYVVVKTKFCEGVKQVMIMQ